MKSLTIRRRILISFAAILAVMTAMAGASYFWFLQTEREVVEVETKTVPGLYYSAQLMVVWADATRLSREVARAENAAARNQASEAALANRARLRDLLKSYEGTVSSETDRRNHAAAAQLVDQFATAEDAIMSAGRQAIANGQAADQSAAVRSDLDPIATKMRGALREMVDFNKAEADDSTRKIVSIVRAAELGLIICFVIALILAILCGYMLFRAVTLPLGKLLGIVDLMRRGDFSERLTLARRDEFSTLADGVNGMADDLAGLIGQIQKSSIQVNTSITEVADQTNLLSLNAAIEAEKAGQYGRGFAVVATEIRRLADQTAVSTYDIEQMVKDIQSAVAAGVMGMDKFSEEVRRGMQEVQQVGGQLSEIIEQVQGLVPRFEGANEGMQAQATGAGQISEALSQLSEAAQQTVESLQQSTLAIDELNQVSNGLRSSISRFKLRA